ncbi:hypothetical protein PC865_002693 [Acinetobacter baumannii]|uniref:Uncharacterized protein n=1 Tax=Acinetobacter baumannii TaxID=470 RepID=A0A241ZEV3_ACIBA|nr:hypothetical protein [Acinetobacter baumannii]EKV4977657.1 hypothetical protein [Acinetobacter baumannii]EKV6568332.1 hypothetical protein [Acinetobacter baumannii]EKW9250746.1 hypothetical protein [Acinetobacter baumannii]ELB1779546.1 hypothetical protein [Acinetobacter baumannii]OTM86432.1 hypothetical protein B9X95_10715 [Acinetobacter baumannii]
MNQITDISQQDSINPYLRSSNKNKTPEKMLAQIDAWLLDEDFCHYFSIQIQGQEVYPFGVINRPFFYLDQAERKLESLKSKNPKICYYISYGAFPKSILDFEDEGAPMWERVWLNQHEFRLINLSVEKMTEDDLVKLIPNYKDVLIWQAEKNTSQSCHYYFAQSFDDSENEITTSSAFYFNLKDALIAKLYFEKTMPKRRFRIHSGVMSTQGLMKLDGRTSERFQELVDAHKERLASLKNKGE